MSLFATTSALLDKCLRRELAEWLSYISGPAMSVGHSKCVLTLVVAGQKATLSGSGAFVVYGFSSHPGRAGRQTMGVPGTLNASTTVYRECKWWPALTMDSAKTTGGPHSPTAQHMHCIYSLTDSHTDTFPYVLTPLLWVRCAEYPLLYRIHYTKHLTAYLLSVDFQGILINFQ